MARNIYDLFNERKNGIDCLVEGLDPIDYCDLEAYENLNEAAEALDTLAIESTNEMIELQAAMYLEDLVLESMMYNDFDEEKLQHVMEAAKEEKKEGLAQKIKNLWQKIKEWFARAFRTIAVHFQSGETVVAKYRQQIPRAMAQSKAKIKCRPINDPQKSVAQVNAMVNRIKCIGKTKEQILSMVGISDSKGIKTKVDNIFFNGEASEKNISDFKPEVVMTWAGNKKIIIDAMKKTQKDIDGEFKQMLSDLNKGDSKNKSDDVANFQFGMNIANSLLSAAISKISEISKMCLAVIRKALSGKFVDEDAPVERKIAVNAKKGKGLLTDGSTATNESWEITDDCDEYNDVEW